MPTRWLTVLCITVVLCLVSFLGTPLPGVNEAHYFTKARSWADSTWCPNDFFLQSTNAHAVFSAIVGPLANAAPFQIVLAVGRIVSLLIVALGLHALGRAIGLTEKQTVFASGIFYLIGVVGNFSGEWLIGGFESKVPAYGFAFLSIAWCIENRSKPVSWRYMVAGCFSGLAIAFHPVVGLWTVIAISMTEVWCCLRPSLDDLPAVKGTTSLTRRGACFVVPSLMVSLPGLLPAIQMLNSSNVDAATKAKAKYIQVFYRLAHHLDPTQFSRRSWVHTSCLVVAVILAWIVLRKLQVRPTLTDPAGDGLVHYRAVRYFMMVLASSSVIAAVGLAIGWHSVPAFELEGRNWRAALLQFYPFRLFDTLLPLSTAMLSMLVGRAILQRRGAFSESPKTSDGSFVCTGAQPSEKVASIRVVVFTTVITAFVCSSVAIANRPSAPAGYGSPEIFDEWKTACKWLRGNCAKDAIVCTPRESFGFKIYAERAEYVCYKDCPQDAGGICEWNQRLWNIHHWSKESYRDKRFSWRELRKLNSSTGITHILTRRLGPFDIEPIWQGQQWRIYSILQPERP